MAPAAGGFGGLLTTGTEHVDLGHVGTRALSARVQRRQLHLALGSGAGVRITLGRLRPVAVEVTESDRAYEVAIPAVADPWITAARRAVLLWLGSVVIAWWLRRRRTPPAHATLP